MENTQIWLFVVLALLLGLLAGGMIFSSTEIVEKEEPKAIAPEPVPEELEAEKGPGFISKTY